MNDIKQHWQAKQTRYQKKFVAFTDKQTHGLLRGRTLVAFSFIFNWKVEKGAWYFSTSQTANETIKTKIIFSPREEKKRRLKIHHENKSFQANWYAICVSTHGLLWLHQTKEFLAVPVSQRRL